MKMIPFGRQFFKMTSVGKEFFIKRSVMNRHGTLGRQNFEDVLRRATVTTVGSLRKVQNTNQSFFQKQGDDHFAIELDAKTQTLTFDCRPLLVFDECRPCHGMTMTFQGLHKELGVRNFKGERPNSCRGPHLKGTGVVLEEEG